MVVAIFPFLFLAIH